MAISFPSLEYLIEEYFQRLRRAGFAERIERSLFRQLLADIGHPDPCLAAH